MILFSKKEYEDDDLSSRICCMPCGDGYQVPPSFETGCSPYSFITLERKTFGYKLFPTL